MSKGVPLVACPKCDGTGRMQTELRSFEHCTRCDGSGAHTVSGENANVQWKEIDKDTDFTPI